MAKRKPREKRARITAPIPSFDLGETLHGALHMFGEEVVFALFKRAAQQQLHNFVSDCLNRQRQPLSPEEIPAAVAAWKPGERKRGKSAAEKIAKLASTLTDEQKRALISEWENKPRLVPPSRMDVVETKDEAAE